MVQEAPLKIYARGVVSYFYFFPARRARARALKIRQINSAIFKSSRWRIDPLGTDSCRGTVPMEPPMSNGSMRHQNPVGDFDDTGQILQGASCTIAHASIKIVFEIGDPAGTSTVALFLQNKSIINSNSLRGNIHTEKSCNRKRLDGTC